MRNHAPSSHRLVEEPDKLTPGDIFMAVICREHKLLFIMTPRTACTAVADLLLTHYGGEYLPAHDVLDSRGRISLQKKHSTLSDLLTNGLLTMKDADGLLKFAAVRNPFD